MHKLELTREEIGVVIAGLLERENRMFRDADIYKSQGNKEAQMDCLKEWHIAQDIREKIVESYTNE